MQKTLFLLINLFFPTFILANTAIFAGGCFWCVQADFDKVKGVTKTTVGFDGGQMNAPTYAIVSKGTTQYAEAVKINFDAKQVSYKQLLLYFYHHIDPLTKNAQFCDKGKQYRSAIFTLSNKQRQEANKVSQQIKQQLNKNIYTEITPSTHFYAAEKYHQNYYLKNPVRYRFYRYNCGRDKRIKAIWTQH